MREVVEWGMVSLGCVWVDGLISDSSVRYNLVTTVTTWVVMS